MKRNTKISLIIFLIILIFLAIFAVFYQTGIIKKIAIGEQKEEIKKEISYEVYHHVNGDTKILVIVEDTENGIEKVVYPNNEMELYCDGKNKVAFDYHVDITDKESITFTAINTKGETLENTILINDEFYDKLIDNQLVTETETQKALTINYKEGSVTKQYKIGDLEYWIDYTNTIRLDDYQILDTLGNENRNIEIGLRQVDNMGYEIITQIKYTVGEVPTYKKEDTVIEGESILACVENNNLQTGNYIFKVTGTTDGTTQETIEYPVELYNYNDNANYVGQNNIAVGNTWYTGMGKIDSDKRMLILKYNKDLTIGDEAIITPTGTNENINGATYLCTKKGMFIYCAGTLTNNGTITMTSRGTVNEVGENVYLYKNENDSYEYVPAIGASGGSAVNGVAYEQRNGNVGKVGSNRRTGGGGSGATRSKYNFEPSTSGRGGTGTSYSGGAGGGAAYWSTASAGSDSGGKGGNAAFRDDGIIGGSGGGAGNPGGNRVAHSGSTTNGGNGTGGLLILYTSNLENKGNISSNGSSGGSGGAGSSYRRRRLWRWKRKYIL